jgi:hypothetical protein
MCCVGSCREVLDELFGVSPKVVQSFRVEQDGKP